MHIENNGRVWANPEIVKPMGVVSARNANGGRAQPRTSRSYELRTTSGTLRNPVVVTKADGTTHIAAGSSFRKSSQTQTARVKKDYNAAAAHIPDVLRFAAKLDNASQYD